MSATAGLSTATRAIGHPPLLPASIDPGCRPFATIFAQVLHRVPPIYPPYPFLPVHFFGIVVCSDKRPNILSVLLYDSVGAGKGGSTLGVKSTGLL